MVWRPRHLIRALLGVLLMLPLVAGLSASPAAALGETLVVVLDQRDGTPDFDAVDGPGLDSSDGNGIVRTNDNLTYLVEISVNDAPATDVSFTLPLPQGVELDAVPPYCAAGSSLTPETLPPPVIPTLSTSWTALPIQTLVCVVGARTANSTFTYPVVATVRPEVPNATVLDPAIASSSSADVSAPSISNPVSATVSARAQFDLAKNSIAEIENAGYFSNGGLRTCADGSGRTCQEYTFPMLISAPAGGRGTSPLQDPVSFVDDLRPEVFYGPDVLTDPDYIAAGANAAATYGPILRRCRALNWSQPNARLSLGDETNSVRESGTTTCTQTGPGQPVNISISGMDSTAYTVPSEASRPDGRVLPANRGYVYSWAITVQIPMQAVVDLGIEGGGGSTWTRAWDNQFTDFAPVGFDGVANDPDAQDAFNDHRASTTVAQTTGGFDKHFVGVPGNPGNVAPRDFNPGWAVYEGPAGSTGLNSGEGQVFPGQQIISNMRFIARGGTTGSDVSFLACDTWDPTLLQLSADAYEGSTVARAQSLPSNGEAVWISGYYNDGAYASPTSGPALPTMVVEYGNGVGGARTDCDDADSPSGWHSDPADVPGNDPAEAANGVYTAVSQVRVHLILPPYSVGTGTYAWVSIGQRATPGLAVNTIIPNWASRKIAYGTVDFDAIKDRSYRWAVSTYIPDTNVGARGDRVRAGGAVVRLTKDVKNPRTGAWVSTTPAVSGGQDVEFRLTPTLVAGVDFPIELPVRVEDCLPAGETYLSSNLDPSIVQFGAPADAELPCPATQTYIRWDLADQLINTAITPIEYTVRIASTATSGVKINTALVSTPSDPSAASERGDQAAVQVTQPSGLALDKVALTPIVEINRPGEANPAPLRWRLSLLNIDTDPGPTDPDIIDLLPRDGIGLTNYSGTLEFDEATVTAGGSTVEILYTAADPADIDVDALDSSNDAATGSTVWCDAPSAGTVVLGDGTAADCPTDPGAVTGLRIRRPGAFGPGATISVEVTMTPRGNAGGDLYDNEASARAVGQALPVGPVRSAERVVDSSIGDLVWHDVDGDGIRDAGDDGIDGVTVRLSGTDSDGNSVAMSTTTAGGGVYSFEALPSGDYEVTFSLPPTSALGTPVFTHASAGIDTDTDSDGDPTTGIAAVTLSANQDRDDIDQGVFYPDPSIAIVKQIDGDDAATSPGVTVEVNAAMAVTFDVSNTGNVALDPVVVSDSTIAAGDISCPRTTLLPGESMQCTAAHPAPAPGDVHVNTATAIGSPVALADGSTFPDVRDADTAYATTDPASISGHVFEDDDNDGVMQTGEAGIGGVTVTLVGVDIFGDAVNDSTTTNPDGSWSFDDLPSGTYTVTETHPTDYLDGLDAVGPAGGTVADDELSSIVVAAGDDATDNDFGELVGASVSGVVRDEFGEPIPDVTITLTGTDDTGAITPVVITTGPDGSWSFEDLRPGDYTVVETQPVGFGDGVDVAGTAGATTSTSDRIDVTLAAGDASIDNAFVETYASISGTTFHDLDDDGVRDDGENAIAGVTIALLDEFGGVVDSTVTDADGSYVFDGLLAGTYSVVETQPASYNDGIDTAGDLGGDTSTDDTIAGIVLGAGREATGYDFAEVGTVVTGTVWRDTDVNGAIDAEESTRLGDVTIRLLDSAGRVVATTTTDETGAYVFGDVVPGDYTVEQIQPTGYGSTTPNALAITVPLGGSYDNDFGEDLGSIAGTVWQDADGDGALSDAEVVEPGVRVNLLDADGEIVATTVTDDDGNYLFDELVTGTYTVEVIRSTGASFTLTDSGDDDRIDSDVAWRDGQRTSIVLEAETCAGCTGLVNAVTDVDAGVVTDGVDLAVDKQLTTSGTVRSGSSVTWTMTVTNEGIVPVDGVTLVDPLPNRLTFQQVDAPGWSCDFSTATSTLTCVADDALMPGETAPPLVLTTRASATEATTATPIVNEATVSATINGDGESDATNNDDTAVLTVQPPPPLAFTGASLWIAMVGSILMLLGLGFWLLARLGRRVEEN